MEKNPPLKKKKQFKQVLKLSVYLNQLTSDLCSLHSMNQSCLWQTTYVRNWDHE